MNRDRFGMELRELRVKDRVRIKHVRIKDSGTLRKIDVSDFAKICQK